MIFYSLQPRSIKKPGYIFDNYFYKINWPAPIYPQNTSNYHNSIHNKREKK